MVNTTGFLDTIKAAVRASVIAEGTHMAVGDDDTTPSAGDTDLGNEIVRKALQEYTEGTSDVILSLWLSSVEGNGEALAEVGLFDAGAAGNLLVRNIFTVINKTTSIEVWIDIEEQIDVTQ